MTAAQRGRPTSLGTPGSVVPVDDNEYDDEYCGSMLGKTGFTGALPGFTLGEDALAARTSGTTRAVLPLLDVDPPGMNGFEVARALERSTPGRDRPIVVMLMSS